eukprot:CAMPEP_0119265074 /NCGR_PEP_ID=MMETSP1329-20130426/3977_1 /TAXON_ID=114041 /ORGANISM="Genus nov. species nov., Strain RCC1024" /LENGTH=513 /DNA_ID=CAMNT_0007264881 /DNA_START=245 /DNA_END=1786 /DNA_ORIENTATION=+
MISALSRFDASTTQVEAAVTALASSTSTAYSFSVRAFMDAKESSRSSISAVTQLRSSENLCKKELDTHHLNMQNFCYRERRLKEEVQFCCKYECAELEKIAAKDGMDLLIDVHTQRLDKLQAELEERKRLNTRQNSLQSKRQKIKAEINDRRALLLGLPSHLQSIKRATIPLLQLQFDLGRGFQRAITYSQIPRPLALIHNQFDSLIAAEVLDNSMDLKLEQEVFPVEARLGGLLIQRSMAQVKVELYGTAIVFRTLPCLGEVVVVEPSNAELIQLFPGDNGDNISSPEAFQRLLTANGDVAASFPSAGLGRTFDWAQWLGGLVGFVRTSGKIEPSSRLVALRLQGRLKNITVLKQQLHALAIRPYPASTHRHENWLDGIGPGSNISKFCSWAVYAPQKDPFTSAKIPRGCALHVHRTYYNFVIKTERKNKISVVVELTAEYPLRAPRFLLQSRGSEYTYIPLLKDAQVQINANYERLVHYNDACYCLLGHQLRKLQIMVENIDQARSKIRGR